MKMNVAIIGLGSISPLHIDAILSSGHNISAICDIDMERCERVLKKYGINAAKYSDYRELLDREELDAVHICTPHHLHAEMVCYALSKNVNTLCEKPLAISREQLRDIKAAVYASSAQLGVVFQNRYNATSRYIKQLLDGKPVTAAYANVAWCRGADYYASDAWRGTRAQEGGGVMINQAIHTLDLLAWTCGMPKSVIAHTSNNLLRGVIEVEDTAFGLFSLENGGNFIINATNAAKYTFPITVSLHAGNDTVELTGERLTVNGEPVELNDTLTAGGKGEWGTGHQTLIADFYRCILSGERFPIGYDEGCKAVKLVLAMYESGGDVIDMADFN